MPEEGVKRRRVTKGLHRHANLELREDASSARVCLVQMDVPVAGLGAEGGVFPNARAYRRISGHDMASTSCKKKRGSESAAFDAVCELYLG